MDDNDFNIHSTVTSLRPTMTLGRCVEVQQE